MLAKLAHMKKKLQVKKPKSYVWYIRVSPEMNKRLEDARWLEKRTRNMFIVHALDKYMMERGI